MTVFKANELNEEDYWEIGEFDEAIPINEGFTNKTEQLSSDDVLKFIKKNPDITLIVEYENMWAEEAINKWEKAGMKIHKKVKH